MLDGRLIELPDQPKMSSSFAVQEAAAGDEEES